MTNFAIKNKRMEQMLRHAGVVAIANSDHRVVLVHAEWGVTDQDPLYRLLAFLEPSSVNGNELMPSVEEAVAMGLVEEETKS